MLRKKVIVGMSGGVDSSLTAALLKEQGYDVTGIFMKNWEEEGGPCSSAEDYQDVVSVCTALDIPYYTVNFSQEYYERVFAFCLKEFEAGYTPNPDILCNKEIKFKLFLEKALDLGADYVATGHYCQKGGSEGQNRLLRGHDPEKDQSYFLYTLSSQILEKVLFPVGHMTKKEVRKEAEKRGLTTCHKKDSTGICFIGKRDFREFLSKYLTQKPGMFERLTGEVVGTHLGMAYYTIGQRKGLAIGGEGQAWYVVGKDPARNVVYVEQGDDHAALFSTQCMAIEESWINEAPELPLRCTAKIRYRSQDAVCTVKREGEGRLHITFEIPQKAVTARQSIVFYQDEVCLGGARIL